MASVVFNSSVAPRTGAHEDPLSVGFSRQKYWSGLPCPPPGDLPSSRAEPAFLTSPALAGWFSTTSATWEAPILPWVFLKPHLTTFKVITSSLIA